VNVERPMVKFCVTRDGTRLAYYEVGDGPPLVYLPPMPQHILLSWDLPFFRDSYLWLAERHRLVRYDSRGTGMSKAASADRGVQTYTEDLEDLVEHLGLTRFTIVALVSSGITAISYAATHPERVAKLVLWDVFPSIVGIASDPRISSIINLAKSDWELFTQTLSRLAFGWENVADTEAYAEVLRRSCTREEMLARLKSQFEIDVSSLLPQITAPTLVVQHERWMGSGVDPSDVLTSGIPNASLRLLSGPIAASQFHHPDVSNWLGAFLTGEPPAGKVAPGTTLKSELSPLRTVLFTDLVGHTEMMSRLGDKRGREVLREHERITREVLKAHGGTEVKTMGDGFMASFGSVTRAVECAIALQRAFAEREGEPLSVRVGINAGEPIEEDGDLFGATVILASRIAAKAEGGEILVADTVRGLCSGKGFLFSDRGEFVAKGFEEPVRVYEVRWRDERIVSSE
jgi:class 3 adenylate cyclase/pimeloyl-ACP methyl ester carboxylesterase